MTPDEGSGETRSNDMQPTSSSSRPEDTQGKYPSLLARFMSSWKAWRTKTSKSKVWRWVRVGWLFLILITVAVVAGKTIVRGVDNVSREEMFRRLLVAAIGLVAALFIAARIVPSSESESEYIWSDEVERENAWLDLLKTEYMKAADRYENLYKAIWQNFSYSGIVVAALLTFAGPTLRLDLLQVVTLSPLMFWFVATFIPLNHYGEELRARLRTIEADLNAVFFVDSGLGFRHFTKFAHTRALWRVGDVVHVTGGLVGLWWLWQLASVLTVKEPPLIRRPAPPTAAVVASPVNTATPGAPTRTGDAQQTGPTGTKERLRPDPARKQSPPGHSETTANPQ